MHEILRSVALAAMLAATGALGASAAEISGEITVWDWNFETETWGKALKQIDAEFLEMHPGVTIKHLAQPHANYYQLWQTANSTKSGPDVLQMHAGTFGVLTYPDSLEPLNDRITPEMKASIKGWESVAGNFDPNGTIYGIPGNLSGWVFYYNKALFAQAGIDGPPKTWDDLIAACEKLKAADILPFALGNQDGLGTLQYLNIIFPGNFNEADSVALAKGEIKYNGEAFTRVNQHLLDLIKAGYFDPGFASMLQWTDAVESFAGGQSAMIAGIASDTVSYNEFLPDLGDDLGVFYAPADTVADPYIPDSSGSGLGDDQLLRQQGCSLGLHRVHDRPARRADPVRGGRRLAHQLGLQAARHGARIRQGNGQRPPDQADLPLRLEPDAPGRRLRVDAQVHRRDQRR